MNAAGRLAPLAALCLSLAFAGCGSLPRQDEEARHATISIPTDIGRLKIVRTYDYPNPRLGTVYAYDGEFALTPDVYVYPNPFLAGSTSDAALERSLESEVRRFRNEIERAVEQGHYDSVEFHGTTDLVYDWPYGTVGGKCVALTIVKNGNSALSHAYIFPVADQMVKIRISHYEYFGLADNMDWFAEELLQGTRVAFDGAGDRPVVHTGDRLTDAGKLL